jgi:hypothetical protein
MGSGGSCSFDDGEEQVEYGPWSIGIGHWPEGFPDEFRDPTINAINDQVCYGCCGGCI